MGNLQDVDRASVPGLRGCGDRTAYGLAIYLAINQMVGEAVAQVGLVGGGQGGLAVAA